MALRGSDPRVDVHPLGALPPRSAEHRTESGLSCRCESDAEPRRRAGVRAEHARVRLRDRGRRGLASVGRRIASDCGPRIAASAAPGRPPRPASGTWPTPSRRCPFSPSAWTGRPRSGIDIEWRLERTRRPARGAGERDHRRRARAHGGGQAAALRAPPVLTPPRRRGQKKRMSKGISAQTRSRSRKRQDGRGPSRSLSSVPWRGRPRSSERSNRRRGRERRSTSSG